jgi:methionyl aminopeptidase
MIKTAKEIASMRAGGRHLARILQHLAAQVKPDISTEHLNKLAEQMIDKIGAKPSFTGITASGMPPFPCALCTSVNEEIVHTPAIPDRILKDNDIVGLDLGLIFQGLCLDAALTVPVGKISQQAKKLINVTRKALVKAIKQVKPNNTTGDIGAAIEKYVTKHGFGVVKELVGHGIGRSVHEPPAVPNYGKAGQGTKLATGMTLAIEPMVTIGSARVKFYKNSWRTTTTDNSLSAHFEHTVLVSDKGHEVLTLT